MKHPEVLSPAGNFDSLVAAVRSGADAVYLGSTEFSARRNAGNFDDAALERAVAYCHAGNVKVYLTLNIMLKDGELDDALALAKRSFEIGVDALILQDLGLAYLIHNRYPEIELHASTQMSVHSPAALPFLKQMGFCRVVVSREMSKSELSEFCAAAKELDMSVEVFVHGALCMSVSGQCLMSAMLGSRSGNRGLCAGTCRLPFSASGGTGYDLSLKDLCLFEHITELESMGVASLKIEGRMKRPEYVAAATAAARQAVDFKKVDQTLLSDLKNVFSRSGFTDGYFTAKRGLSMFGIRTKEDVLSAPDAIKSLHTLYRNERQNVGVDITVDVLKDKPITASFRTDNYFVKTTSVIPQIANNKPTLLSDVTAAFSKLGGTHYFAKSVSVNIDNGLFVSGSTLNAVRRALTEMLDECAGKVRKISDTGFVPFCRDTVHKCEKIFAQFENETKIPDNLSVDGIILPFGCNFNFLSDGVLKIVEMPRYIENDESVLKRALQLKKEGVNYALCGNLSSVKLALDAGLCVIGDRGLNIANSISAEQLRLFGVNAAVLSPEATLAEISDIKTDIKKGIFAYGNLPLMLVRNCPLRNGRTCGKCDKRGYITDRLGVKFPVRCRSGYSEILNSVPICLSDRLNDIKNVDFLVLKFTDENEDEVLSILNAYKTGTKCIGEYTKGLYYRNVL